MNTKSRKKFWGANIAAVRGESLGTNGKVVKSLSLKKRSAGHENVPPLLLCSSRPTWKQIWYCYPHNVSRKIWPDVPALFWFLTVTKLGNVLKQKLLLNDILHSLLTMSSLQNLVLISTFMSSTTSTTFLFCNIIVRSCSLQTSVACGFLETQICSIKILKDKTCNHHCVSLLMHYKLPLYKIIHYTLHKYHDTT